MVSVPYLAGPSSSAVSKKLIEPKFLPCERKASTAAINAIIDDFISTAPRPYNTPSSTVAVNGSYFHLAKSPTGTTSVWPAKQRFFLLLSFSNTEYKFRTSSSPSPNNFKVELNSFKYSAISSKAPASVGVILFLFISS